MEAGERRDRGEIVVGDASGEESDEAEWGLEDEVDEEAARRRKAGVRVHALQSSDTFWYS